MEVEYHKNFVRNFKKRFGSNHKIKEKYKERLKLFLYNSSHPFLKDHQLTGSKDELRAFSITGDIRVVYKKIGKRNIFLDIGTHNQVY